MDFVFSFKFLSMERTIAISRRWVQFVIITSAILASTVIAFWGNSSVFIMLLVLLGGVATILALLSQPNFGFILILLGGIFIPITGPSNLSAATVMVALMLGLWLMNMFVVHKKIVFIRSTIMTPIVAFLVISILSFLIGQIPWFVFAGQAPLTAQVGGFAVFIFSIGGVLLAAHLIKDVFWLKIITWTFIAVSAGYILARVFNVSAVFGLYHGGFVAQSMFWTWLVALLVGQLLYNNQMSSRNKVMLYILLGLTFYVAIGQGYEWKSGWVPPMIAVVALLAIRYRKLVVFAIPLVAMMAIYVVVDLIAADSYSWGTRVDAWRIILEISRVSPLLGMGFANYYWYTPLFPIRGWRVSFNSHSQFIDLIAQTGYLGLIAFFWLFFEFGRLAWTVARKLPDGFARGYSYGVLAGIFATVIAAILGDWVLPFVYNVGLAGFRASILPWIFIGGVISLEQMLRDPSRASETRFV
jgi:hypothetical protein